MIIRGARLFDSERKEFMEGQEIWIEEGLIREVGRGFDKPGREVLDLSGMLVLPGWVDSHVHLTLSGTADPIADWQKDGAILTAIQSAEIFLRNHLRAGVTVVRDVGGAGDVALALKKAVQTSVLPGPEVYTAGRALTMTGGHIHQISQEVDGVDEARKGAREELKKGVDLLKVIATGGILTEGVEVGAAELTEAEIRAIVEEAHKSGHKVAAHAEGYAGIENALRAGIDTLEHGIGLGMQAVQMLKDQEVVFVPTLAAPRLIVHHREQLPQAMVKKAEAVLEEHRRSFDLSYTHGCRIAVGTDAGTSFNQHGSFGLELRALLENGMKAEDVLQAATLHGAIALGIEDYYGNIRPGKIANLTVIEDNLEENWYQHVKVVMVRGNLLH